MAKTKTKNSIERIGKNKYRIWKNFYTAEKFNEIVRETQEELKDFNFNFLTNWEDEKI